MTTAVEISADGSTLVVHLPMKIKQRGGRKLVIAPQGATSISPRPRLDGTLVKAIARAYRWQRLLEEGTYASMRDLAAAERISPTYVSRVLRLTLLSPAIVESVLNARGFGQAAQDLLHLRLPDDWHGQRLVVELR